MRAERPDLTEKESGPSGIFLTVLCIGIGFIGLVGAISYSSYNRSAHATDNAAQVNQTREEFEPAIAARINSNPECKIELQQQRFVGKFISPMTTALVIPYFDTCIPRAMGGGGAAIFELVDGKYHFRASRAGYPSECVSVTSPHNRDRLVCIQQAAAPNLVELLEPAKAGASDRYLLQSVGFLLDCSVETSSEGQSKIQVGDLSKLEVGTAVGTVSVLATYCAQKKEKEGRLVIDLNTLAITVAQIDGENSAFTQTSPIPLAGFVRNKRVTEMTKGFEVKVKANTPSTSQMKLVPFKTPSGNIYCTFDDGSYQLNNKPFRYVRCDMKAALGSLPPRPADCKYTWDNKGYSISDDGTIGLHMCRSDTTINDSDPNISILSYGRVWQRGGFTCKSEQSGLTCINSSGHGFALTKEVQRLF